jgi:hypothetical protein
MFRIIRNHIVAALAHFSNISNPHGVTKSQVGLGNADNTSDLNKPISNATQTALNLKANVTALESEATARANADALKADKSTTYTKTQVDTALGEKVDKVTGKSLIADTEIARLAAITGTNTGDETTATIKTKLGIATLSGSNTGDQDLSGILTDIETLTGSINDFPDAETIITETDIINNLTTGGTTKPLSAEMGKSLKGLIDGLPIFKLHGTNANPTDPSTDCLERGIYFLSGAISGIYANGSGVVEADGFACILYTLNPIEDFIVQWWSYDGQSFVHRQGTIGSLPNFTEDDYALLRHLILKADLVNGKVPSSQLPSLLALGETSSTAYRGDRGKTAYEHSQITNANPHGTTTITGNAGTATKLQTPRKINGVDFDGSTDITVTDGTKIPTANINQPNGVVGTGTDGRMAVAQLPNNIVADYTVSNLSTRSMLASDVSNNGSDKILITIPNHGFVANDVLELSGAIPSNIIKVNNLNYPLVHNKAYVNVINPSTNNFEIALSPNGTAISYVGGGTNGWVLSKLINSTISIASLNLDTDGGEYAITVSGMTIVKSLDGSHSFRINNESQNIYFSTQSSPLHPTNQFYFGGGQGNKKYCDFISEIRLKRVDANTITVVTNFHGINSNDLTTNTVFNFIYGGKIRKNNINITSFECVFGTVNLLVAGSKIIIRRIN